MIGNAEINILQKTKERLSQTCANQVQNLWNFALGRS